MGSTVSRRVSTRAVVWVACGRVVGMTLKTAVVPDEFTADGVTDATPLVLVISDCIVDSSELFAELDWLGSWTTTVSGLLVCRRNVASTYGKEGDELAVALARNHFGGFSRLVAFALQRR